MRAMAIVVATLGLVALVTRPSRAACPESCISRAWTQMHCSSSSQMDTTSYANGCTDRIAYDLSVGTATLEHYGGFSTCGESVSLEDSFVMLSSTSGAVPIEFVLTIDYHVGSAGVGATLEIEGLTAATWSLEPLPDDGPVESATQIAVQANMTPGVPTLVRYTLGAGGSEGIATLVASLSVSGLPAGAHLTSCQGFSVGTVQLRAGTWGRVKALYR